MHRLCAKMKIWKIWGWTHEVISCLITRWGVGVGGLAEETQTPVASLTKMMTALIVLKNKALDEKVLITSEMTQGLAEYTIVI